MIRTLVFSPAKNGFKSVISIFCCSESVGNISLHFQTFILPLIVLIQWDFCLLYTEIWSSSVCLEWHEETEQTETDSIQKNCVSKTLQETSPQSFLKNSVQAHRGQKLL